MRSLYIKKLYPYLLYIIIIVGILSCEKLKNAKKDGVERLNITVSIGPHGKLVKSIGGEYVKVNILIPNGVNHETYEPSPKQFENLSDSIVYFLSGANHPFEKKWVSKFSKINPKLKFVFLSEGIPLIKLEGHHHDHEASDGGLNNDPHTWLSPKNLLKQIKIINDNLKLLAPQYAGGFEKNSTTLTESIQKLDLELTNILSEVKGKKFITFHPFWGYFARDYGLVQLPIEVEGKEPSGNYLTKVIEEAKKDDIRLVVSSPQFNRKSAEIIAREINGYLCYADPMSENYAGTLLNIARSISTIVAKKNGK